MNALEERIRELRQRYARTLPGSVAEIGKLLMQSDVEVLRADLLREFHKLAGTAGTFGYEDIATLAWEAECILFSNSSAEVTPDELGQVASRLVDLDEALSRCLEVVDGSRNSVWSTFEGGGVM